MDYANLARLLIRIGGLFAVVLAIGAAPTAIEQFILYGLSSNFVTGATVVLASVIVPGGAGLLLFRFAGAIANRAVDGASPGPLGAETGKLESVAVTVIGWYLLASAIIDLIYVGSLAHMLRGAVGGNVGTPSSMIAESSAKLIGAIGKLVIGSGLVLGARTLVALRDRLILRLRPLQRE